MKVQTITASTRRHILSEKYLSDEMMTKSKSDTPLGVKVLAGLAGLAGVAMVSMSMGLISGFAFQSLGGLVVVLGLFYIAYAVGLWTTESWAWWIGMITNGISILSAFRSPIIVVICLAMMVYLYSVRDIFEIPF